MRLFSTVTALVAALASAPAFSMTDDEFSRQLAQYSYFTNSPATFGTLCRGGECFSAAQGHTSLARTQPVSTESLFSIGSNSKLITAILTLRLVDQGVLRLEDRLEDFFPEYRLWKGVTVRDLLQHSSGVPPYLFSQDGIRRVTLSVFNWHTRIWKPEDLVGIVAKMPLIFTPGSKVEYNNTNYVLLGMILQKAAQKPLADLLRQELFAPLGMEDTYLSLPASVRPRRVSGYLSMNIPVPGWLFNLVAHKVDKVGDYLDTTYIFNDSFTWAAGGMVSTSGDLAKLVRGLFEGRVVSAGLLEQMKVMRSGTVLGLPFAYGLGLMRLPSDHGDLYGHGGLTPGYQTLSNYLPSRDLTLILSQNLGPGQLYSLYYDLLDAVVREDGYRDFLPSPQVAVERLENEGIHVRFYGKITDGTPSPLPFPKVFGHSKLKSRSHYSTYQTYGAKLADHGGSPSIVVDGHSGGNIFAGPNAQEGTRSFVRVVIDRIALLAEGPALFSGGQESKMIFVYRGEESTGADGIKKECIHQVMDRSRPVKFQIDGLEGESFEINHTIKFVGNIPLKPLSMADIPEELSSQRVEICR